MALSDILNAIGGGLKTGGQDILQGLRAAAPVAAQIGIGGGQALGNAMQAQGNPLAFQAAQAAQRQKEAEDFQSKQGGILTAYQQAVLDQQKQAHIDVLNQQLFENKRQLAEGIAGGQFDPTSTLQNILPIARPKPQAYTISPDSDIGQALGLKSSMDVSPDKALEYGLQYKGKEEAAQAKKATADLIEQGRLQGHQEIDEKFNPERFRRLYGSADDPDMENDRKNFHSQLDTAAATDKKQGNTTQIDQFFRQLREHKSDWEQNQLSARKIKADSVDKRNDQSYQFNVAELNRERKPIDDMWGRLGRLRDTVNSSLPPADALIPAELLTVMAGGMGSGLRINEAEIQRAMTGQTHWQDLKAALQKWSLDPSKGLSVTPEYRQSLNNLLNIVGHKIQRKQDAFSEAEGSLVSGTSPFAHRRAMLKMHHDIEAVDQMNLDPTGKPIQDIGSPYGGR